MRPSRSNSAEWASKLKAQAITTSKRASAASRAAATRSARATVPNSGPTKIAARRSLLALHVAALGADQFARPGRQRGEGDAVFLVRLLHAGGLADFRAPSAAKSGCSSPFRAVLGEFERSIRLSSASTAQHPVRRQALDRERAGDADTRIVGIGLVIEVFELGLGGDRGIDLLLPRDARLPPVARAALDRLVGPARRRPRAGFPIPPSSCSSSRVQPWRAAAPASSCQLSQITSISALLAIDFSVMCGTRS